MKTLVLHYNNLPLSIIKESLNGKDDDVLIRPLAQPPTDREDFDSFVSDELSKIGLEQFSLIVMPLNFTETYMEFTGLRVAAHIRLTEEWKSVCTPILFLGSEKLEEIMQISQFGVILNTFNIYYLQQYGIEDIKKMLELINNTSLDVDVNSPQYKRFLDVMKIIPAPSNYSSHHSIANEWAILRWSEMHDIILNSSNKNLRHMLYFKYLMAIVGEREFFSKSYLKRHQSTLKICGINNCRIVVIDDEISKGWKEIFEIVLKKASGANVTFFPFNKSNLSNNKERLIDDIKLFIKNDFTENQGSANCYIIDLRLHDDDFNENTNYKDLSGHKIAEYIKSQELNPYNQVVVFTASNKIWNYEKAVGITKASGYAVKESPEQNLSKTESKQLYDNFCKAVKHACDMSYLSNLYTKLDNVKRNCQYSEDELTLLYQFIELLNIDNGINQEAILKACVLTLSTFLEVFCKDRFLLTTTELFRNNDSTYSVKWIKRIFIDDDATESSVKCYDTSVNVIPAGFKELISTSNQSSKINDKAYILVPLFLYYNLTESELSEVNKLKNARNKVAHEGKTDYTIAELINVFKNIILKVLKLEKG